MMNGNGGCPAGTSHFGLATLASGFTGFFVSQRRKEKTLKTDIIQRCAEGHWQFFKIFNSRQLLVSNH